MDPFCMATTIPVGFKTNPAIFEDPAADANETMLSGVSLESKESGFGFGFDQMSTCPDSSLETIRFEIGSILTVKILKSFYQFLKNVLGRKKCTNVLMSDIRHRV